MAKQSPFAKVQPFIDAFREVTENGFFQMLDVSGTWYGNLGIGNLTVRATGYIPDRQADMKESVAMFIHPGELMQRLEQNAKQLKLSSANVSAEVTVAPWVRYNKEETEVIGTIGRQFNLVLRVFQNTVKS